MVALLAAGLLLAVSGCAEHVVVPTCGGDQDAGQASCNPASGELAVRRYATEQVVVRELCERTDPDSVEACVARAALPAPDRERCLVSALSCRPAIVGALECYTATQDALLACLRSADGDAAIAACVNTRSTDAVACGVPGVTTCQASAAVHYERLAVRSTYDGAVDGCRAMGGELATEHGAGSLSAITAACSVGLPTGDLMPCWTAIPIDREGSSDVITVGPKQPVFSPMSPDFDFPPGQDGYYAVCEVTDGE